jgi:hypothetical protein
MAALRNFWVYVIAVVVLISSVNYLSNNCIEKSFSKILNILAYVVIAFVIISSLQWNNSWQNKEDDYKSEILIKNVINIFLLVIIVILFICEFRK